ncbi:MAG: hypothetical protein M1815_000248 [Lichina confinis]|nr:MAG: hypothetical protein M1815_000248 [Lichina confinis]
MGKLGSLSPTGSVVIGVLVGLISTCIQSLGLTLQRKSHLLEDEKALQHVRRPPYRRRRWQLGMTMFIFSNVVGSSIQITTLPLPVLSTLQASGLVFNAICATLILGEPFTRWSLGGTTLVCAGAVLIGTFGAMKEPAHSLDELLDLLGRRSFIMWMIGQGILVGVILVVAKLIKMTSPRTKHKPGKRLARGMAYGCISGVLSAHCLLIAKSAVELLVRSIFDRANQFNRWQSWMILLGLVVFALTQLYYLHRGLKLCSTSILYPFVFCIYNITAILDGLIYFRQTSKLSVLYAVLIALGTAILLSGVLALSWRLDHDTTQRHMTPKVSFLDAATILGEQEEEDDDMEDSGLPPYDDRGSPDPERRPLLRAPRVRRVSQPNGTVATPAKYHHRRATLEAAEIWNELEDDGGAATREVSLSSLSSPVFWRRASMPLPARRVFSGRRSRRSSGLQQGLGDTGGNNDSNGRTGDGDDGGAGPVARSTPRARSNTTATGYRQARRERTDALLRPEGPL